MNQHFDEAYYQNGSERGTQYRDYLEGAKRSRTYFEIAQTIVEVLRPRRTLEIGCATGVIVSHLRTFDVDAHGIDVSEWAVENKCAETVIQGTAENLPFEDGYFDLVYSVHALEHLPPEVKDKAFDEICRVCSGFQFHMMPMLESGPYVGDRFGHLLNLRTDPTHKLLYEREWWIRRFEERGYKDSGVRVSVIHDNEHYELSDCQILMHHGEADSDLVRKVAEHDHRVAGVLSLALNGKPGPGLDVHINRLCERFGREPETGGAGYETGNRGQLFDAHPERDDRSFLVAKVESQQALIKTLMEEAEQLQASRSCVDRLERTLAAGEERSAEARTEVEARYAELAKLTKAVLAEEERAEENRRLADQLLAILRGLIDGGPQWWNLLPRAARQRRQSRRLARLGIFDAEAYGRQFPDVVAAGFDPLRHYVMHGIDELRAGTR